MDNSIGHKAVRGTIWATIDRFSTMGINFIVNLVLTRMLAPADFGAVGMLAIFIAISSVIIDGGFPSALIQKKNPTQVDYSTIFYWNIALSLILYTILFVSAPYISGFFKMPVLCGIMRGIGLTLPILAVTSIQMNRLRKQLKFSSVAIVNICSVVIAGGVGVLMACYGFGVWSLVAMQLINGFTTIGALAVITRWHPSLRFSKATLRSLFGFGGYIFAANILQEICKNFQGLIIGRRFSATQMGFYSQAYKLDMVTSYSIPQTIVMVMYPVYSYIQDDRDRLIGVLAMNIRVIAYIVFPILSIMILLAEPLIIVLYGAKWATSIPYYQILCVGGMFVCLQNVNFYAVAAVGKSKVLFKWSFYKWGFLLSAIFVGSLFGVIGLLWGMVVSNFNIYIVNAYLTQRYVGYRLAHQLFSIFPIVFASGVSLLFAVLSNVICGWYHYTISMLIFCVVYFLFSMHMKAAHETIVLFRRLINKKHINND